MPEDEKGVRRQGERRQVRARNQFEEDPGSRASSHPVSAGHRSELEEGPGSRCRSDSERSSEGQLGSVSGGLRPDLRDEATDWSGMIRNPAAWLVGFCVLLQVFG